jgi:predicted Zn-ribbon and HTH transcriptional regulator
MLQNGRQRARRIAGSGLMLATLMAGMLGADDDAAETTQSEEEQKNAAKITRRVLVCRCLRCAYEWMPRVENPAQCPACKSALWNTPREARKGQRKYAPRGKPFAKGLDPRRIHQNSNSHSPQSSP